MQEHGVCWVNNNQWFEISDIDDVRWSELNHDQSRFIIGH